MNKEQVLRAEPADSATLDKGPMIKQVLTAIARGTGSGVVRVALTVLAAVIVNVVGATIFLIVNSGVNNGGHGMAMIYAAFVALPFMLGVIFAGIMAYKQGLMGVFARVLETQAGNIASLGSRVLEKFLQKVNYQPGGPVSDTFLGQWRKFLKLQDDLPKPLPFLLDCVASRVPFSETITEVATTGMTLRQVAHAAMERMVQRTANGEYRPEAKTLFIALGIEFLLWIPNAILVHYWFKP